jgi:hypothetical protein
MSCFRARITDGDGTFGWQAISPASRWYTVSFKKAVLGPDAEELTEVVQGEVAGSTGAIMAVALPDLGLQVST